MSKSKKKPTPRPRFKPAPMPQPAARRFGLGTLTLVAIGTASLGVLLTQCDSGPPPPEEVPIDAQRGVYLSQEDCQADWGTGEDRCEPEQVSSDFNTEGYNGQAGGGGSASTGSSFSTHRYLGPFYTRSGTVYEFDGRQSSFQNPPSHMLHTQQHHIAPAEIYTRAGRYGSTAAHAQAGVAKSVGSRAVARGGFGARVGSSGG